MNFGRRILLGILFSILLTGFSFSQVSFAANHLPVVNAGSGATLDEGDTFSHIGSFTLPDAETNWTATVDYGSGDGEETLLLDLVAKTFSLDHLYNMHAPFQLTVTITNGTHTDVDTITVDVQNVSPIIDSIPDAIIDEGDTFSYSGTFTDPGFDEFIGTVTYGDFDFEDLGLAMGASTFDLERTFVTDEVVDVLVTISDDEENSQDTAEFTITVNNVTPTLSLGSGGTIAQGETFVSSGSFTDPGEDLWVITADFGDGTVEDIPFTGLKTFDLSHTYLAEGTFDVTVTIFDGDDTVQDTISVTVTNVSPTVDAGPDATLDEGDTLVSMGSFTEPGSEPLTISVDYGDGTSEVVPQSIDGNIDINHLYANDGVFILEITVDDELGGIATDIATITVNNISPEITIDSQSVDDNRNLTGSGSFTDPGDDAWSATVDYGDGAGEQLLTLSGKTFSLSHNYAANGVYDAKIIISDDDISSDITIMIGVFISDVTPPSDLNSPSPSSTTLDKSATFTTSNQDIWSPVTSGGTSSWNLFPPQTWNEVDGDSDYVPLGGLTFGGGISAGTNGHLNMKASATNLNGEIGVSYPGDIEITYPDTDSFLAGETLMISNVWDLDESNAKINAGKSMGDLRLDLDLGVNAFTKADVCFFGCFTPFSPSVGFDMHPGNTKLFSFTQAGDLGIPPALTNFAGLTGNFNPISVQPPTTFVHPTTGTIVAEKTNTFSNIIIDIDKVATKLGIAPPLGESLTTPDVGFSYDFFDADANIDFMAHQKLTFDTNVLVKFDFSRPVEGVTGPVVDLESSGGKVTSVTYKNGDQIKVIFPLGETDPIVVTPTLLLDSKNTKLHHFTEMITESDVTMKSLDTSLFVDSVTVVPPIAIYNPIPHFSNWGCHERVATVCVWSKYNHGPDWHKIGETPAVVFNGVSFSVGPVWESGPQGQEIKKDTIVNDAFALGGFNTVTLATFELNPQVPPTAEAGGPYEVLEGSVVQLLGTGEDLDGDPITFAWDFDGDMIYETSGATVDYPLGIDGPDTLSAELQVCDIWSPSNTIGNCDEDFATIVVINVAPTLDAGEPESVDEGSLFTRTLNFEDPGTDTWDATVDWGDGTTVESIILTPNVGPALPGEFTIQHTYADDGDYTTLITITDDDGGVGTDSIVITVLNVNPTVDAGVDQEVVIHDTVNLDPATYSDPGFDCGVCGTLEDFTAIVNWGEFSDEPLTVTEVPGSVGVLTEGTASGSHIYRLPGDYTVTVTVDDDDTGSTSDTLITTVLGAQDLKNRANSFLAPYDAEKEVEKAIDAINDSLDSKFWINDVYLDEKHGKKVFDEEKKAVKELQKLLKDGAKKGIDPALEQVAQDSIDLLVNADRVLAITIMLDASSTPADDPKKQKKVDEENEKSAKEFAKADGYRDDGDYDKAIDHYKKAWEHAHHALKHAAK